MRPTSWSFLPAIAVRSSSVSLPHFSRILPVNCFQLPSMRSQFMAGTPLGEVQRSLSLRPRRRRCFARPLGPGGCSGGEAVAVGDAGDTELKGLEFLFNAQARGGVRDRCVRLDLPPLAVLAQAPFALGLRHGQ